MKTPPAPTWGPAPKFSVGTMVHYSENLGAACQAAMIVGYNEYGSVDLAVFSASGITFRPAWYGETVNDCGWHEIH